MKIAINLLPIEFRAKEIKAAKFYKIQTLGVAIVLMMIFLASLTVGLRILQSQNMSVLQNRVAASEGKISGLKNTQASLFLLKNRLTTIKSFLGVPSLQSQMYTIVTALMPPSVSINSISVDKSGEVLLLLIASDGGSVDDLITNLSSKESNEGKISQVSLETVSRGRDGLYRLSLKIKPK